MSDVLADLTAAGVAVWLDDLSRERLVTGNLERLARERHVVGVTSNPTIFAHAMKHSDFYTEQLRELAVRDVGVGEAVRAMVAYDVRWGCDVLAPAFERTGKLDGRVSLEVDPNIAHDADRSVAEAKALWWLVDRPNLYIKIPATAEGIPAITRTLAEGISVNVTLIFSLRRYDEVMDAFMAGMEQAADNGHDLSAMASIASFFVSRVDTEVDKRLDKIGGERARALRGRAAIANARLAYQRYERVFASDRWRALAAAGARPQRPLWASTSTKDPAYGDTRYVVDLVAPGVVNTMPEPTIEAMADHGELRGDTVRGADVVAAAQRVLDGLGELGIDYDDVVRVLEDEGVQKFADSWTTVFETVSRELDRLRAGAR
ncbi:MAG TPA: transaldolase [Mycobacteriales bacterium]|nr:transaldolase [Mycobacteriales bacterium]